MNVRPEMIETIDVVLVREPVRGEWWKHGPGAYEGDLNALAAQQQGIVPDQALVWDEYQAFIGMLEEHNIPYAVLPFPNDLAKLGKHDGVFIRDSAVILGGKYFPAKFKVGRQEEAPSFWKTLDALGLESVLDEAETAALFANDALCIEGGEVDTATLANGKSVIFTGAYRNSIAGNAYLARRLGVAEHITLVSPNFHRDTGDCPITVREKGRDQLAGYFIYREVYTIESIAALEALCIENGVRVHYIDKEDSMSLAVNAVNIHANGQDYLIGTEPFAYATQVVLEELGVEHVRSPLTQYRQFGSGGAHCSIHVVETTPAELYSAMSRGLIKGTNVLQMQPVRSLGH